jgi:hypothetical protein
MREEVRRRYAAAALLVWEGGESSCCGGSAGRVFDLDAAKVDWSEGSYSEVEMCELPRSS